MKVELKNIKYAPFLSEETNAFSATIYLDGKRAIGVSNTGHGAGNEYYDIVSGSRAKLSAYARTLPPIPNPYGDKKPFDSNIDWVVDRLFNDWLNAKADQQESKKMKKDLVNKIMFVYRNKPGVFSIKIDHGAVTPEILTTFKTRKDIDEIKQILNELPFEEAFKVQKAETEACLNAPA